MVVSLCGIFGELQRIRPHVPMRTHHRPLIEWEILQMGGPGIRRRIDHQSFFNVVTVLDTCIPGAG
jgi:hypothetical protein